MDKDMIFSMDWLGGAVTVLGLIVVMQQFLKPIYEFRLSTKRFHPNMCYWFIIIGFVCSMLSQFLFETSKSYNCSFLPKIASILNVGGAALIIGIYAYFIFCVISRTRINDISLEPFLNQTIKLLSKFDQSNYVDFSEELSINVLKIILYAKVYDDIKFYSIKLERERIRELGQPSIDSRKIEINAFTEFRKRLALKRARLAGQILGVVSDEKFCEVLVCVCPITVASIFSKIDDQNLYAVWAEKFIQELVNQAIICENSQLNREIDYGGFCFSPLLSEKMFCSAFILGNYNPLGKLSLKMTTPFSKNFINRFNKASELILETIILAQDNSAECFYDVESIYKHIIQTLRVENYPSDKFSAVVLGIEKLCKITIESFKNQEVMDIFFQTESNSFRRDHVYIISLIICNFFEIVSNKFQGDHDEKWFHAIRMFLLIYPPHEKIPDMDPLQQNLAIMLVSKLEQNVSGQQYPSISRVLVSLLIQCLNITPGDPRNAFMILKAAVCQEIKKLPELYVSNPRKVEDFLPSNIKYDDTKKSLFYRDKNSWSIVIKLSDISDDPIDLTEEINWKYKSKSNRNVEYVLS